MASSLKTKLIKFTLFCSLTTLSALDTDDVTLQKLRDACGNYFGATVPLPNLSAITASQITPKLSATDFANITNLLTSAAKFYANTAYLTEITNFQTAIKAASDAKNALTAAINNISTLNSTDLLQQILSITPTTDPSIKSAIIARTNALYETRTTNPTKDTLTSLIALLKAAQTQFTSDTSFTGKVLQAALEEAAFEPNPASSILGLLTDPTYINYAKLNRVAGATNQQAQLATDQFVYDKIIALCPEAQINNKTMDELNQVLPFLLGAEAFFDGAAQKNGISNLRKNCQFLLNSKKVLPLSNTTASTITDFTTNVVSNPDYNNSSFGSIFQTIYQICLNKLLGDLTALTKLTPIPLSSLSMTQQPQELDAILNMLLQAKNKDFLNLTGTITIGNQSFNPGDENSANSAKNTISNLLVSTRILKAISTPDNMGKLSELKNLADSLSTLVSTNSIGIVTQTIFASAVLSAAKAANIDSSNSTLQALLTSATQNNLLNNTIKTMLVNQLTLAPLASAQAAKRGGPATRVTTPATQVPTRTAKAQPAVTPPARKVPTSAINLATTPRDRGGKK